MTAAAPALPAAGAAALSPSLCLYHLPLHPPSAIPFHAVGSFSRAAAQELCVVASSSVLQLLAPDDATGRLQLLCSLQLFSEVLAIAAVRFLGSAVDLLCVTSDSGFLTLLTFDSRQRRFVVAQQQLLGKTGTRRGNCGHYIAVEAKGRAIMTAALERSKMAFILNREQQTDSAAASSSPSSAASAAASSVRLSSPLEAHKSGLLTLSLSSLDVGFDNPVFAALEAEYETGVKQLSYYELDLGLNHVTRRHSSRVDPDAHCLLPVPGLPDGPGGLLILCDSYIIYHPYDSQSALPAASPSSAFPFLSAASLRVYLPRRHGIDLNPSLMIIASSQHVQKGLCFFLLQSEHGDLYKLTLSSTVPAGSGSGRPLVRDAVVSYFDSIPVSCGLSILKSGYLFCASESSAHVLYQIVGLGERQGDEDWVSSDCSQTDEARRGELAYFHARRRPRNLLELSTLESLHPILDLRVSDPQQLTAANIVVSDPTPVIYALCGKSTRSSLRFLRHGLQLTEMAASELPALPTAVFTIRTEPASPHHSFIVLSFASSTTVLSVGEQVSEVPDSAGLLESVRSLLVSSLSDGSLLQVHAGGLRHVRSDRRVNEWRPPGKKQVTLAAGNERCVVCCLSGGELVYFEMDRNGLMIDMYRKDLMNDVAAIAIAPTEAGKTRGRWLLVAGFDETVRVFSTDPTSPLQQMSLLAVNGQVAALLAVNMTSQDAQDDANTATTTTSSSSSSNAPYASSLFVYTGLVSGVEVRSRLDPSSGVLSEHRKRFLGPRPLSLHRLQLRGSSAVLALADRAWLDFCLPLSSSSSASGHQLLPLSYDPLDAAADFSSPQCEEGLVAIVGSSLRILAMDALDKGDAFFSSSVPLRYTPRKMEILPSSQYIAVIESEQNTYSRRERSELEAIMAVDSKAAADSDSAASAAAPQLQQQQQQQTATSGSEEGKQREGEGGAVADGSAAGAAALSEADRAAEALLGAPYAGEGRWASCISVHAPPFVAPHPPFVLELEDNEAATALAAVQFDPQLFGNDHYLAVATAKDLSFSPRRLSCGFVHVYHIFTQAGQQQLRLLHKTPLPDVALALAGFQRRLLVGVGRSLRVYEMGKRRLLKKSETRQLPVQVLSIDPVPNTDRVVIGDMAEGFAFLLFDAAARSFSLLSDSSLPRFLTARCLLDSDSIAGADKFGNVFVSRLPQQLQLVGKGAAAADAELAAASSLHTRAAASASSAACVPSADKLVDLTAFHLDSIVTAMVKASFRSSSSSASVLLCSTISGGLSVFLPLPSLEEAELLTHLEMHLRAALPSVTGRDHLALRSALLPVKGVIDGALVEHFTRLPRERRRQIAEQLLSTDADIRKKLEDIRSRVL